MPQHAVSLMYDRDCGFCVRCANLLRRLDRRGRVRLVAWQDAGALAEFGVTEAEALEAAWARDAAGVRHRGAGAVNAALSAALATGLPLRVYRLPGVRRAQDTVYGWVAENRHRMPGGSAACAVER